MHNHSYDGVLVSELPTPSLLLDKVAFYDNINYIASYVKSQKVALRPHSKSHKCPSIAKIQIDKGAKGICCARLGEAAVMLEHGVTDILLTSPIVTEVEFLKVIQLNKNYGTQAHPYPLTIVVDQQGSAELLATICEQKHYQLPVVIDLDVGTNRTGCKMDKALEFASWIDANAFLILRGFQAYAGHLMHIPEKEKRDQGVEQTDQLLLELLKDCQQKKITVELVSKGGTGTYEFEGRNQSKFEDLGVEVELQLGSYIFMDTEYREILDYSYPLKDSLRVLGTVISEQSARHSVCDVGFKAMATDTCPPALDLTLLNSPTESLPERSTYSFAGDEHGAIIVPRNCLPPKIGSKVTLLTSHCDPTVNLHSELFVINQGKVEEVWPIQARNIYTSIHL